MREKAAKETEGCLTSLTFEPRNFGSNNEKSPFLLLWGSEVTWWDSVASLKAHNMLLLSRGEEAFISCTCSSWDSVCVCGEIRQVQIVT